MKVARDRVVAIDYTIRTRNGEVVESSVGGPPLRYLHGRAQIMRGVEEAIDGREEGVAVELQLEPAEGYGERDPDGVFRVPRAAFPPDEPIGEGMIFSAVRPDGRAVVFRVLQVGADTVLVDANHPLAGKSLDIWVLVRDVRDATDQELVLGQASPFVQQAPLLS